MSDTIANIKYSNNGKLYAGMTKENIRADINAMTFSSEAEREKAYNKQIKLFDYANSLVEGEVDDVISEREIEAYNKKEKNKNTWKTIGLVGLGVTVTIASITLAKKFISNSENISNIMNTVTNTTPNSECLIKENIHINKENLISEIAKSQLPKGMVPRELTTGKTLLDGEFGELIAKTKSESVIYSPLFIGQYNESGNVVVNNYLRTGKNTSKHWSIKKIKDVIDSAHDMMNRIKLQHDTILYRGVQDFEHIPEVGEIFKDNGFISTSANPLMAHIFGRKMIKIIAPEGTKCMPCVEYLEILLNSGSEFKILSKNSDLVEMLLL